MAINTCIGGEVGEITPDQLACLRSVAADAEREVSAAYQRRLQITTASARRDLASVQKLWARYQPGRTASSLTIAKAPLDTNA